MGTTWVRTDIKRWGRVKHKRSSFDAPRDNVKTPVARGLLRGGRCRSRTYDLLGVNETL